MHLDKIVIRYFRGIHQLDLTLKESSVLIGENQWGKKSLFDAVKLLLAPKKNLYLFQQDDFFYQEGHAIEPIYFLFTFLKTEDTLPIFDQLACWQINSNNKTRLYYAIKGQIVDHQIVTTRYFCDESGDELPLAEKEVIEMVTMITQYYPVLFLQDLHSQKERVSVSHQKFFNSSEIDKQTGEFIAYLVGSTDLKNKKTINRYVNSVKKILTYYFILQNSNYADYSMLTPAHWRTIEEFSQFISVSNNKALKMVFLRLFLHIVYNDTDTILKRDAIPILLVDDIGGRFHPIMMSAIWQLLTQLPSQKITATNSSEMVSLVPLENISRLVRYPDHIYVYQPGHFNTSDTRKLTFHIRFFRASSLFSRGWILVEGETEIWLLTELARHFGYQLEAEGIKVIEFAQCGVKPLIRFARDMGIEWHVLVDGDDAGQKYAQTVKNYLEPFNELPENRLTILPSIDMEMYLYKNGFSDVYKNTARNIEDKTPSQIIQYAINRTSKPDLAIKVAEEMKQQGFTSVPPLLKKLFSSMLNVTRTSEKQNEL